MASSKIKIIRIVRTIVIDLYQYAGEVPVESDRRRRRSRETFTYYESDIVPEGYSVSGSRERQHLHEYIVDDLFGLHDRAVSA